MTDQYTKAFRHLAPMFEEETGIKITLDELLEYPFICREEGSGTREVIGEYLGQACDCGSDDWFVVRVWYGKWQVFSGGHDGVGTK